MIPFSGGFYKAPDIEAELDKERVQRRLKDEVIRMCKSEFSLSTRLKVQGLISISTDTNEVFLVQIDETLRRQNQSCATDSAKCEEINSRATYSAKGKENQSREPGSQKCDGAGKSWTGFAVPRRRLQPRHGATRMASVDDCLDFASGQNQSSVTDFEKSDESDSDKREAERKLAILHRRLHQRRIITDTVRPLTASRDDGYILPRTVVNSEGQEMDSEKSVNRDGTTSDSANQVVDHAGRFSLLRWLFYPSNPKPEPTSSDNCSIPPGTSIKSEKITQEPAMRDKAIWTDSAKRDTLPDNSFRSISCLFEPPKHFAFGSKKGLDGQAWGLNPTNMTCSGGNVSFTREVALEYCNYDRASANVIDKPLDSVSLPTNSPQQPSAPFLFGKNNLVGLSEVSSSSMPRNSSDAATNAVKSADNHDFKFRVNVVVSSNEESGYQCNQVQPEIMKQHSSENSSHGFGTLRAISSPKFQFPGLQQNSFICGEIPKPPTDLDINQETKLDFDAASKIPAHYNELQPKLFTFGKVPMTPKRELELPANPEPTLEALLHQQDHRTNLSRLRWFLNDQSHLPTSASHVQLDQFHQQTNVRTSPSFQSYQRSLPSFPGIAFSPQLPPTNFSSLALDQNPYFPNQQ